MNKLTLILAKPHLEKREVLLSLTQVLDLGFVVIDSFTNRFSADFWREFYQEHRNRDWFEELIAIFAGQEVTAFLLCKNNAIEDMRKLLGHTDPQKSLPGTIRAKYGVDLFRNAFHASSSFEEFVREYRLLFKPA